MVNRTGASPKFGGAIFPTACQLSHTGDCDTTNERGVCFRSKDLILLINVADGSDGTAMPSWNSKPDFDAALDSQSDWVSMIHTFPEGGMGSLGTLWDSAVWHNDEPRTVTAIARVVDFFI